MVKRYVVIDTDDDNPSDMDLELGPVYEESEAVGSADAYLSDTEADALMVSRPAHASWTAATADQKNEALKEATRRIDGLPLRGNRYEEKYIENGVQKDSNSDGLTQTLEFPRVIDGVTCDWDHGTQLPIVPDAVKWACLEEAIAILAGGSDGGLTALQEQGVSSMSIGGKLSYSFVAGAGGQALQSATAKRLMRRYVGAVLR